MTQPVINWMLASGLQVKKEFSMPWGICDLVGLEFKKRNVASRLELGQRNSIGSIRKIALLKCIPDEKEGSTLSLGKLERLFGESMSADAIIDILGSLIEGKFVVEQRKNCFQRRNGWEPLQRRLVAVELKLARFEEAFSQARCNQAFAIESFVAFPHNRAERIFSLHNSRLRECGIGLLGVDGSQINILTKARARNDAADTLIQAHVVERFWRTALKAV